MIPKWIEQMFRKPSVEVLIAQELQEAERSLLRAQSGKEYAEQMVAYHNKRVSRLRSQLAEYGKEKQDV